MKSLLFLLPVIIFLRTEAQTLSSAKSKLKADSGQITSGIIKTQCYQIPDGRIVRLVDGDTVEGIPCQPIYVDGDYEGEDIIGSLKFIFIESYGLTAVYASYIEFRRTNMVSYLSAQPWDGPITSTTVLTITENPVLNFKHLDQTPWLKADGPSASITLSPHLTNPTSDFTSHIAISSGAEKLFGLSSDCLGGSIGWLGTYKGILNICGSEVIAFEPITTSSTLSSSRLLVSEGVLIGTKSPEQSSILTINSTKKGVLLSKMTSKERRAIVNPVAGLEVFDTDLQKKCFYNGKCWEKILSEPIKE